MSETDVTTGSAMTPLPPDARECLPYYGLQAAPFLAADPELLWLGKRQREMLAALTAAIRDGPGIFVITSDIGAGKASLTHSLVDNLSHEGPLIGRVAHPGRDVSNFFQAVANAYRSRATFDTEDVFLTKLQQLLRSDDGSPKKVLLIIDEAQSLSHELLREIRDLSVIGTAPGRSLAILLVGQNEFSATLSEDGHAALRQRITLRCTLDPLTPSEVGEYIGHCLKTAGAAEEIFTPDAIRQIAWLSNGAPDLINTICGRALLAGYGRQARTIGHEIVEACSANLSPPHDVTPSVIRNGQPSSPFRRRAPDARGRKPTRGRSEIQKRTLRRFVTSRATLYVGLLAALILIPAGYIFHAGWLGRGHEPTAAPSHERPIPQTGRENPAQTKAPVTMAPAGVMDSGPESSSPPVSAVRPPPTDTTNRPLPARAAPRPVPPKAAAPTLGQGAEPAESKASSLDPEPRRGSPVESAQPSETKAASSPAPPDTSGSPRMSREPAPKDRALQKEADTSDPAAIIDWLFKEGSPGRR
jgi:general secretion pathway protein A